MVQRRLAELRVGSGTMTAPEAAERVAGSPDRLLPEGPQTPQHHVRWLLDDEKIVGDLWLSVAAGREGAFLYDVRLTPEATARGLGPAAMDLAEQTARVFGATVVRINVFTDDGPTRALVEDRGYEPTATQMVRRLAGPPGGPTKLPAAVGTVVLSPMTLAQYEVFIADQEADFAAEIAASGSASPAQAAQKAAADMAELLPDGRDTPHQLLCTASAAGATWAGCGCRSSRRKVERGHSSSTWWCTNSSADADTAGRSCARASVRLAAGVRCRSACRYSVTTTVPAPCTTASATDRPRC